MGKTRNTRGDKEHNRIQRMSHENKRLKQEITRLRNTLSRIDYGWCPGCIGVKDTKEFVPDEDHIRKDDTKPVKKDRACYKCRDRGDDGVLIMIRYSKVDETWYFRRCMSCGYRTKGKRLTPEVQE